MRLKPNKVALYRCKDPLRIIRLSRMRLKLDVWLYQVHSVTTLRIIRLSRMRLKHWAAGNGAHQRRTTNNKTLKNEIETLGRLHRDDWKGFLRIIRLSRMRLKRTPRDRPITIQSTTNNKTLKNEIETIVTAFTRLFVHPTNNKTLKNEIETRKNAVTIITHIELRIIRLSRMRLKRTGKAVPCVLRSATNNKTLKNEIETMPGFFIVQDSLSNYE